MDDRPAIISALGIAGALAVAASLIPATRPAYLPDPRLTPGAVLPGVTREDTCDPGYAKRVRHVTEATRRAVFRRYGLDPDRIDTRLYEIDHYCPLSIAGSNDILNLWPQPWKGEYGATAKDRLEFHAYKEVCAGRLTIREAQAWFLADWTIAYRRVFPHGAARTFGAAPPGDDDDDHDGEGFPR